MTHRCICNLISVMFHDACADVCAKQVWYNMAYDIIWFNEIKLQRSRSLDVNLFYLIIFIKHQVIVQNVSQVVND